MEIDLELIAIGLGVVAIIGLGWCMFMLTKFKQRLTSALGGPADGSIETLLTKALAQIEAVDNQLVQLTSAYKKLAITSALASQKISVVRFNPFGDTGGDQSFTLAVLDGHDSGYVLTSIHGREGTRVYVKPIDYGKSKYPLSGEEKQAFTQAAKRVPNFEEVKSGQKV